MEAMNPKNRAGLERDIRVDNIFCVKQLIKKKLEVGEVHFLFRFGQGVR